MIRFEKRIAGLSQGALQRFVLAARRATGVKGTVNVVITGSAAMRALNHKFRGKNEATDVLSFPAPPSMRDSGSGFAGEIAISADMATENALRLGHGTGIEIKILVLHGILHLAGYDHERDNGRMARREAILREMLRLPSGLIERTDPAARNALKRKRGKGGVRRTA